MATWTLSSCIADEPLNAECDILAVDPAWISQHSEIFAGEAPVIKNNSVEFSIKRGADVSALDPVFVLTEGARIEPANGTTRDFGTPQTYRTTAADGVWSKAYTVAFKYNNVAGDDNKTCFSFDNYEVTGKYYNFFELNPEDGETHMNIWDSGNAGYAFTGRGKTPEDYPTTVSHEGYKGDCALLRTCNTGSFGAMAGMPIAAGNLFIGEFEASNAMKKPLLATRFGRQLVTKRPVALQGYYKYTSGEEYTILNDKKKGEIIPGRRDECDIYSVVYEVDPDNFVPLYGDNVLTDPRIVGIARIANPGEPSEWTYFDLPYTLAEGKAWDETRMTQGGYAIAVVFSSSRGGANFSGAVGSTLYVDEVTIVWADK